MSAAVNARARSSFSVVVVFQAMASVGTVNGSTHDNRKSARVRNAYRGGHRQKFRALVRGFNALMPDQRKSIAVLNRDKWSEP